MSSSFVFLMTEELQGITEGPGLVERAVMMLTKWAIHWEKGAVKAKLTMREYPGEKLQATKTPKTKH